MKVQERFSSFDEYEKWWHRNCVNSDGDMYSNGQYDEFPYIDWSENKECPDTEPYSIEGKLT